MITLDNLLNQQNYVLSEPEVTVKKIIDYEKAEPQEGGIRSRIFKKDDSHWENQTELYLKIERFICENPNKIPTWEVASPLNYGMTLSKMKAVIQEKFQEGVSSGKIMTERALMKTKDRSTFYPERGKGDTNLTRIWGANFLKSNLQEVPTLDAAEHYLIVDGKATEIEVQVWHSYYPILSIVKNAHILSQKIVGDRAASSYRFSPELDKLKYRDFSDLGNIIRDSNGVGWVVDTEHKSFDAPTLVDAPTLGSDYYLIQNYLKTRFKVLTGDDYFCLYQTFKISLTDIGLK